MSETLALPSSGSSPSRRALGRKYRSEEAELRLLERFAGECRVSAAGRSSPRACWTSSSRPGHGHVRAASTTSSASSPA